MRCMQPQVSTVRHATAYLPKLLPWLHLAPSSNMGNFESGVGELDCA